MASRRNFLRISFFGAAQIAMPSYARQFNDQAANEADAIAQMKNAEYPNLVLVNKANGSLIAIEDGHRILTTPVILGSRKTPTPTGIFSLQNLANGPSYPKMVFHFDDRVAYLIHGVIAGRERAILKDDPRPRQLSAGCINIDTPFLEMVLNFAREKAKETLLITPIAIMPEAYSPKHFAKMVSEFKPKIYGTN
jgi:L,D-transpeptidase catalytic domain